MTRIHWPSTARTGRLMSRVYDSRQSADVLVILDLQRGHHFGEAPESSLEYAVSVAASLCHAAIRRGQAFGLVTNDAENTAFGAGRGEAQRLRVLDYLATCMDDGSIPLDVALRRHGDGWRGRGSLVAITSNRNQGWVEALIDLGVRGQRHLAVFVEPTSFGAPGPPMRIPASWRLALDWWQIRRGDELGGGLRSRAV